MGAVMSPGEVKEAEDQGTPTPGRDPSAALFQVAQKPLNRALFNARG